MPPIFTGSTPLQHFHLSLLCSTFFCSHVTSLSGEVVPAAVSFTLVCTGLNASASVILLLSIWTESVEWVLYFYALLAALCLL